MGRSFIDLATLLYSLLSYKFPWISVFSTACFFSERVLIPFVVVLHYTGRTRHFIFVFASLGGLHVEHFKDGYSLTATGRAHSVRLLFFHCRYGRWCTLSEHGMPLALSARLFLSTRTGIECQQDMLGGGGNNNICPSGMSALCSLAHWE